LTEDYSSALLVMEFVTTFMASAALKRMVVRACNATEKSLICTDDGMS
jgi:hypothetical protein